MKLKIFKYNSVDSTNDIAIELIKKKKYKSGFVYALTQKKGRGRRGKKWISKKGNLFATVFFCLKKNYPSIKEFSVINAILNIDVLSKYCDKKNIFFKPPNDIYINKKKICGMLQEVIIKGSKKYLIVGIGINLFSNPKIKNYPSTSVYKETKKKIKLSEIINRMVIKYEQFFSRLRFYQFLNFKVKSEKLLLN